FWENIDKNLSNLSLRLSAIREKTDLIILPEMFNTGFTMNVEKCAEKPDGQTMHWMMETAHKYSCVVAGSLIIEEDGKYYNRFSWMLLDSSYVKDYRWHLVVIARENELITSGNKRVIVELHGWTICTMICDDLRLSVCARGLGCVYDVLLYVA